MFARYILKKYPQRSYIKVQVNKKRKDIKLSVISSEVSHTQIPHHVEISHLNFDKI